METKLQNRFLLWLNPDESLANERLEEIRDKLYRKFRSRPYLPNEDVKDLVQETIARVIKNLENGKIAQDTIPEAYIHSVANNVLKEKLAEIRRDSKKRDNLSEEEQIPNQGENPEDTILTKLEQEQYMKWIEYCKKKMLTSFERELLKYYEINPTDWTDKLVERFGLSANALRIRMYRIIRKKLAPCVKQHSSNEKNQLN